MPFPNPATQWKPGQTGNPLGRISKRPITDEMVAFLLEEHPKHPGKTRARVLAEKRIERSEDDSDELEKLLDRVEGKVPQPTQQLPTDSLSESVPKDDRSNPVDP